MAEWSTAQWLATRMVIGSSPELPPMLADTSGILRNSLHAGDSFATETTSVNTVLDLKS